MTVEAWSELDYRTSTACVLASLPFFLLLSPPLLSPSLIPSIMSPLSFALLPSRVTESDFKSKEDDMGCVILSSFHGGGILAQNHTRTHTHTNFPSLFFFFITFASVSPPLPPSSYGNSWHYTYSRCGIIVLRGQLQDSLSGFKFHFLLSRDTVCTERWSGGGKHASRPNITQCNSYFISKTLQTIFCLFPATFTVADAA